MASEPETPTVKFDPQTYLLSYTEEIYKEISAKNHKYNYVYCLNTNPDYSFPATLATLTNRINAKKFTELKTHQYNSLVPKIRLFRVEYNSDKTIKNEKEFLFAKDTKYSISNMMEPIIKNNCGIKSINWKLAGSNPVTAEKQIEVEIQFYFDSINSFSGGNFDTMRTAWVDASAKGYDTDQFKSFDTDTTTKNYWSLIMHPNNIKNKDRIDLFDFRIKAFVGWEDFSSYSPNILSEIFKDQETIDVINDLNYSFFLNLIKHQFNLNEDGSLTLTTNYIAEFESTTLNYNFNILSNLKQQLESLKNKKINNLIVNTTSQQSIQEGLDKLYELGVIASNIESNRLGFFSQSDIDDEIENATNNTTIAQLSAQQKLFVMAKDKDKRKNLINCLGNDSPQLTNILKNADNNEQIIEKISEDLNKIAEYSNERLRLATTTLKNEYYSKFMKKLTDVSNSEVAKYYAIEVNENTINAWSKWVDGTQSSTKPQFTTSTTKVIPDSSSINTELQNLTYIDKIDNLDTKLDNAVQNVLKSYEAGTTKKIVFTTFGHIIDTAYNIIEQELLVNNRSDLINELKRQKVILGNMSDEYPALNLGSESSESSESFLANFAFIPIEINLLQTFLIENIVKAQKDSYPLYSFIKDAIATLIVAALNVSNVYNNSINKYANSSMATTIVSLGNNSIDQDPIINFAKNVDGQNSSVIDSSLITKNTLQSYYINSVNKHTNHYNYFIIYDKKNSDYKPLNDPDKDAQLGVFHYTYGQDYGLIKSINFSRIDTPYLKEAKAVGKKTLFLGQFRDLYNADITMIGNNIYYPGMLLYIRPSVEVGIAPSADYPSFSQITGIGGYYFVLKVESSITEDGYETKLQTYWSSDGFVKNESLTEEQKCNALLQEAGLIKENADSSSQLSITLAKLVSVPNE